MTNVEIRKITINDTTAYFKMTNINDDPDLNYVHGLVSSSNSFEKKKKIVEYLSTKLDFIHDFGFLICRNQIPVGFILATQDRVFTECLNVAAFCKKDCRSLGIMTEAMFLFINYLKTNTSCHHKSLILDIKSDNQASIKSAKKIGAYPICTVQYMEKTPSNNKEPTYRYIKKI